MLACQSHAENHTTLSLVRSDTDIRRQRSGITYMNFSIATDVLAAVGVRHKCVASRVGVI